ncbi:MAG: ATP-binding protein [Chloroflexia bacterium]
MNAQSHTPSPIGLLQTLVLALTDAPNLRAALCDIVRETCLLSGWEYGEAWVVDPGPDGKQRLVYLANWHATSPRHASFAEQSKTSSLQCAEGIVGHAWSARAPIWIKSLPDDPGAQHDAPAVRAGLTVAFALPLLSDETVIAVLAFFMPAVRDTDQAVVDTLSESKALLGALLKRKADTSADANPAEQGQPNEDVRLSQALLSNIVGSALDAILSIDDSQHITLFNTAAEQMFQITSKEAIGQPLDRLIPERFRHNHGMHIVEFGESGAQVRLVHSQTPIVGLRANGEEFPLEASISQATVGGRKVFTAILRDTTGRLSSEEAHRAQEAAEEANKAKSEFLSRMSHELRTPLNSIIGFADLLNMESLGPRQRENLGYIRNAGQHLLQLVNEVLDITGIESGSIGLSLEPVHVVPLAREALDMLRPLAASRYIQADIEVAQPDIYVQADRQRLKQVLLNLVSNAIKYNVDHGSVLLKIETYAQDTVEIAVTDTGIGIAPEKIGRLFMPFERLGAEQLGAEGTGLGLALTKRLVEVMSGSIGVESTPGTGSIFRIQLPRAHAPVVLTPDLATTPIDTANLTGNNSTVLYVEDNLSNIRLVERILEHRQGIKLLSCMQGRMALDIAREHKPDVVLLDIHLPDMSGHNVLEALKSDPATRNIPVLIISADATTGTLERLVEAGARGYLTKPIEVRRFLRLIDDTLI